MSTLDQPTVAQSFSEDPRVIATKQRLLDLHAERRSGITAPRPADPALAEAYKVILDTFAQQRGGSLFFPFLGSGMGNGALVELSDGSIKYDFITGIGAHFAGHCHPEVIAATLDAGLADTVMQGNLQKDSATVGYVSKLLQAANAKGAQLNHAFLTSTGVMAGENALKIAFQKHAPADRILAFQGCFAGRTIGLSAITDKAAYRDSLPLVIATDYVPFFCPSDPKGSIDFSAKVLRNHLRRHPGRYAAMFFELVQGEGGFHAGDAVFHRTLMEICHEHDVAVMVDEVQTFARLPEMFAFQYYGLDDLVDIVWIGKASQVCATLFRTAYKPRPGLLSQTFTASTTALRAGEVVLDLLQNGGYYGPEGKIVQFQRQMQEGLLAIAKDYPNAISCLSGDGAMLAFVPFDGSKEKTLPLVHNLFDRGLMTFIAGGDPWKIRLLPPVLSLREEDITAAMGILREAIATAAQ